MPTPEHGFSDSFVRDLSALFALRRDVRHFLRDPVPEPLLGACIDCVALAPSVGLSEPWRFVRVDSSAARAACLENFETANADALAGFAGEQAATYARLKLSGMREAPVQLAVFTDETTKKGAGLGVATMPEMRAYSVVGAIMYLWLAARARGLGLGWISILDPGRVARDLAVEPGWKLVAYLCLGWPAAHDDTPELQRAGWETRSGPPEVLVR